MAARGTPPPDEWTRRTSKIIGRVVRRYRRDRGLEVTALSASTTLLGHTVPTEVIHNMEQGRRANIPITDILVLAAALDVPAVLLLFPIEPAPDQTTDRALVDFPTTFEPLPGREVPGSRAVAEFCGEALPDRGLDDEAGARWRRSASMLDAYRLHRGLVLELMAEEEGPAAAANGTARPAALLQLAALRERMHADRLAPPDLPKRLTHELADTSVARSEDSASVPAS